MASRRDQLHSYQFMIQRVVAALVMRETDPAQSPFRRAAGAIFAGIMVGAIGIAGFMVYGLWKPGGNSEWMKTERPVVLVEEETGATYVKLGATVYPTENFTSAMLIAGAHGGEKHPTYISRNSLSSEEMALPRGPKIGIPNAPDSLPSQDNIDTGNWTVCTQRTQRADELETVMLVGHEPETPTHLAGEQVLLVEDATDHIKYLIYNGHRFEVKEEQTVLQGLSMRNVEPMKVDPAWWNALPAGQDIKPLEIEGDGEDSSVAEDATVGQVYTVQNASGYTEYYVALQDRLASITEFQANIQIAKDGKERPAKEMLPAVAKNIAFTDRLDPRKHQLAEPPRETPQQPEDASPEKATCAVFDAAAQSEVPTIMYDAALPPSAAFGGVRTRRQGDNGENLASRVVVAPGKGMFVYTSDSPDERGSAVLCLVTDTGKYYTLPNRKVLKYLGYDDKTTPLGWMPVSLVARLDRGPSLDPDDAMNEIEEAN